MDKPHEALNKITAESVSLMEIAAVKIALETAPDLLEERKKNIKFNIEIKKSLYSGFLIHILFFTNEQFYIKRRDSLRKIASVKIDTNDHISHDMFYKIFAFFVTKAFADLEIKMNGVKLTQQDPKEETIKEAAPKPWLGSRALGKPFKEALEDFVSTEYKSMIGNGLTKKYIGGVDKKLYGAINNYEKRFGEFPFYIPSVRDIALKRFEEAAKTGLSKLPRREKDSVLRLARRLVDQGPKN